jgi:hypothetical protein
MLSIPPKAHEFVTHYPANKVTHTFCTEKTLIAQLAVIGTFIPGNQCRPTLSGPPEECLVQSSPESAVAYQVNPHWHNIWFRIRFSIHLDYVSITAFWLVLSVYGNVYDDITKIQRAQVC